MNNDIDVRVFTESTENMGLMYDSYRYMANRIDKFLDIIDDGIKKLTQNPEGSSIDLKSAINDFKSDINKKIEPNPIAINDVRSLKSTVKSYRDHVNKILGRYSKLRNKVAFGGNYLRAIDNRPKVYSKEISPEAYENTNRNIRNIDRALDWSEKALIDLFNLVDQDLNILTIVGTVYASHHIYEDGNSEEQETEESSSKGEQPESEEPKSMPKQTDAAESNKNGVRRKKLYIAFIEWCKKYNNKNAFGSIFDKDAFHVSYPFVPEEMRYFYRLANPLLCVLAGNLTFFPVSELRKLNIKNIRLQEIMIFAATEEDLRVFNKKDKKVYRATEENGITLHEVLGETFDLYIQKMVGQGDILNAPLESDNDE